MAEKKKPTASDWAWAMTEYRRGTTIRTIAQHIGVSHPAVAQRAKRYSWPKPERDDQLARRLPSSSAPREIDRQPSSREPLKVNHADLSPAERILDCLGQGMSLNHAAKAAGITKPELAKLQSDPTFELQADAAAGQYHLTVLRGVNEAIARGDMATAKFVLERNPALRADYGRDPAPSPPATLNVQFFATKQSAPRADLIAARVIDADDVPEIEGEVLPALPPPSD